MQHQVRPARSSDLPALVEIYNHFVEHSHVTFDLAPVTVEGRTPWFESFDTTGPYRLQVAVDGADRAVGYASTSQFRTKAAYHPSVESSVYIAPRAHRRGLGTQLYESLLEIVADEPDVHRVYGGVALPNDGSVALHERCGFTHVGTFHEVGHKFGRFWDVAWYEKNVS